MSDLAGKPLRYLIGADGAVIGKAGEVVEAPYGETVSGDCVKVAYVNLLDEYATGEYGPYLDDTDVSEAYGEGVIDPDGPGWEKNLAEQFGRAKADGFEYVELDNPDAYSIEAVINAIDLAASYDLKVIAKNPGLMGDGAAAYVVHPNIYGIIVERDAGDPHEMHVLRVRAGKPDLPVWFVAFGHGRVWAKGVASDADVYSNMGVTYSSTGEYGNSIDLHLPK